MPTATPISRVNDFVIRFANVNGSGSASANEMFARAVMRMGVPVAQRNIFQDVFMGSTEFAQFLAKRMVEYKEFYDAIGLSKKQ